jgi:hypothetical protein
MADVNAKKMKSLEIVSIAAGPALIPGMVTVTIAMKDPQGGAYYTHMVTRNNYAHSAAKALGRMRGVKMPAAPEPQDAAVKIERTMNTAGREVQ